MIKDSILLILGGLICCFGGNIFADDKLEISGNGVADIGTYPAQEERSHIFRLTNRINDPITLKAVRSTCACLTAKVNNKKLLPGESFDLSAVIKAGSVTGRFSKVLYLETDLPEQRFFRLELKGEARSPVMISPGTMLYAGKLQPGREYEFQFELKPVVSGISLSVEKESRGVLTQRTDGWRLTCRLTPKADELVVKRTYRICIDAPAGAPPIDIEIRGTVERKP